METCVIPDARIQEQAREELLAELERLDVRERGLQAQRRDVTHRFSSATSGAETAA